MKKILINNTRGKVGIVQRGPRVNADTILAIPAINTANDKPIYPIPTTSPQFYQPNL